MTRMLKIDLEQHEQVHPEVHVPDVVQIIAQFGARAVGVVSISLHDLGQTAQSDALLEELARYKDGAETIHVAQVYVYRSEPDLAFEWLDRAWRTGPHGFAELRVEMLWGALHPDPRWTAMIEDIGIRGW